MLLCRKSPHWGQVSYSPLQVMPAIVLGLIYGNCLEKGRQCILSHDDAQHQ
jgi:hypothetical protein